MSLALKLVLSPVLIAQAMGMRRRVPALPEATGPREGQLGSGAGALRVLIAGDSSAAGVGVATQDHAFAVAASDALEFDQWRAAVGRRRLGGTCHGPENEDAGSRGAGGLHDRR